MYFHERIVPFKIRSKSGLFDVKPYEVVQYELAEHKLKYAVTGYNAYADIKKEETGCIYFGSQ